MNDLARNILLIIVFSFCFQLFGQNYQLPLQKALLHSYESELYKKSSTEHTSIKPVFTSQFTDSLLWQNLISLPSVKKDKEVDIKLFPVLNTRQVVGDENKSFNRIGIGAIGKLSNAFTFQADWSVIANQYSKNKVLGIDSTEYLPHLGRFDKSGSEYYWLDEFNMVLSYKPAYYFQVRAGKGKNFLGDGYRSLFLSDNASSFPFVSLDLQLWKFRYFVLYSLLNDSEYPSFSDTDKKYNTLHYLSFNLTKRFNISVFESVTWSGKDTINHRGYDINYLNPVIFFRPVEFSLDDPSPDNVLLGLAVRYNFFKNYHLYGQFLLDDFALKEIKSRSGWWANKQGIQIGVKAYNVLNVKELFLLSEINLVRPFTYAHLSSLSNYGHQYESLAHPLGSNFLENVNILRYKKNRFLIFAKLIYSKYAIDSASVNMGNNIYKPYETRYQDYGNKMFQGVEQEYLTQDISVYYNVYPKMNLNLFGGIKYIRDLSTGKNNKVFVNIGITTFFRNDSFDY